jgi:hypothetical protein
VLKDRNRETNRKTLEKYRGKMFSRFRQSFENAFTKSVKTESSFGRRRLRFGSANSGEKPKIQPTAVAVAPAPPADKTKWLRNGFFAIIGLSFIARTVFNPNDPNSLINKMLYPYKKGKWILKVERLDDKIANYQTAYTASAKGIPTALIQRTRDMSLQKIGLQVWCHSFFSDVISPNLS